MVKKLVNSYFMTCEDAETILKYTRDRLKAKASKKKIWEEIRTDIDPDIPSYDQFCNFLRGIDKERRERALAVLREMKDISDMTESDIMETALNGTAVLGNVVIKQTIAEAKSLLKQGKSIPSGMKKEIMDWFFKGADASNKQKMTIIKTKQGELLETVVDNLMAAAQYQKLNDGDNIVDGEFEEQTKKELVAETKEIYGG